MEVKNSSDDLVDRGERPIKLSDSWFSPKYIRYSGHVEI